MADLFFVNLLIFLNFFIALSSIRSFSQNYETPRAVVYQDQKSLKKLTPLISCAAELVESQFNGAESALHGLEFFNKISEIKHDSFFSLKPLEQKCKAVLRAYKKKQKKGYLYQQRMSQKALGEYLEQAQLNYSHKLGVLSIAHKAKNSSFICHKSGGLGFKAAFIFSLATGFEHYKCTSPLGRRVHFAGPTIGLGLGVGITVDTNFADPNYFELPIYSTKIIFERDVSKTGAIYGGLTFTSDLEKQKKSEDFSFGLGLHVVERSLTLFMFKRRPKFRENGIYEDLGLI